MYYVLTQMKSYNPCLAPVVFAAHTLLLIVFAQFSGFFLLAASGHVFLSKIQITNSSSPAITTFGAKDSFTQNSPDIETSQRQYQCLQNQCLVRDLNRCEVTGFHDNGEAQKLSAAKRRNVQTALTKQYTSSRRDFTDT